MTDPAPDTDTNAGTGADPAPTPRTAIQRTDLTSPGLRGVAERLIMTSVKRLLTLLLCVAVACVGTFFAYPHFRAFETTGDLQAGSMLMVFVLGGHIAQSFLSRDPARYPHQGYTIVNAIECAALFASLTFLFTVPMSRSDVMLVLACVWMSVNVIFLGFVYATCMRREAIMATETPSA